MNQKRIDTERARVAEITGKRRAAGKQKPSKPAANDEQNGSKTEAKDEHLQTHAGVAVQSQSQSQPQGSELRSGADAPPPPEPLTMRDVLWRDGIPILRKLTGYPDTKTRALLGSLLKSTNDDCARVYRVLREAHDLRTVNPVAWIKAACDDARAKNRVTDSLAGIFGVEVPTSEPPTVNLFNNEWTDQ